MNVSILRLVVVGIILEMLIVVTGIIILILQDKAIPSTLETLSVASVTGLLGLLGPSRDAKETA